MTNGRFAAFQGTTFVTKLFSLLLLLSQTASAQESATVTLGWDASDSPGIAAYRLYYGPQSGAYTNFMDFPVTLQGQVPGLAWGGTYYFAVTAVSSNGMESIPSNEVSYRLPQSDVEPTISDLWDRVTAQDVPIAIPFQLNAAEATDPNLTFSAWSSDPALVPVENILFDGSGTNRVLVIIPAPGLSGASRIHISASIDSFTVAASDFLLVVAPTNAAPTLDTLRDRVVMEDSGGLETVKLTGISSGAAGERDTLTIIAGSSNPALIPHPLVLYNSPNAVGFLYFRPRPNAFGTAIITVIVDDGQLVNNFAVRNFFVTVIPQNDPPQIAMIPPQIIEEDTTAVIPICVTDVENAPQDLQVTATSSNPTLLSPQGIQIIGNSSERLLVLRPSPNQSGNVVVTLFVTDREGSTTSQGFQVTVVPINDPPTLNQLGNIGMIENTAVFPITLFNISSGASNESDLLTVSATSSNPALIPDPTVIYVSGSSTGRMILRPVPLVSGTAVITVTVSDGPQGSSFSQSFSATVISDSSILSDLPAEITVADQVSDLIAFTAYEGDAEMNQLQLRCTTSNSEILSPNQVFIFGAGSRRLLQIYPNSVSGTVIVTLTATDGYRSVSRSILVHIISGW